MNSISSSYSDPSLDSYKDLSLDDSTLSHSSDQPEDTVERPRSAREAAIYVIPVADGYRVIKRNGEVSESHEDRFVNIAISREKSHIIHTLRTLEKMTRVNGFGTDLEMEERDLSFIVRTTLQPHMADTAHAIIRLFKKAAEHQIADFMNDHGQAISVIDLVPRVQPVLESVVDIDRSEFDDAAQVLTEIPYDHDEAVTEEVIKELKFPNQARELPRNELHLLRILQRVYPYGEGSNKLLDPYAVLMIFPKYATTERFFYLIQFLLNSSDRSVPKIQKRRLLSLCLTCLKEGYYEKELSDRNILEQLSDIANWASKSDDPYNRAQACELHSLISKQPPQKNLLDISEGDAKISDLIGEIDRNNFREVVKIVADDCFKLSCMHTLSIPIRELLVNSEDNVCMQSFNEWVENLSQYVRFTVLSHLEGYSKKETKLLIRDRVKFWIDVAFELSSQGDYSSAMSIVGTFCSPEISRLFLTTSKGKEKRAKEYCSQETFNKWTELFCLFSPRDNYSVLRSEINKRLNQQLPLIPHPGFTLRNVLILAERQGLQNGSEGETLHQMGDSLLDYWKNLKVVRDLFNDGKINCQLETDILSAFFSIPEQSNDDYWYDLSTQAVPT